MRKFIDILLVFGIETDQINSLLGLCCNMIKELVFKFDSSAMYMIFTSDPEISKLKLCYEFNDYWQFWWIGEIFSNQSNFSNKIFSPNSFFVDHTFNRIINTLNGHFLLFGWNKKTYQWHIWTNRFATLQAYYGTNGKQSAIGTFFPAVAEIASLRKLDWLGLIGFFKFGFFPEDRTYFEDVRILRPASHYIFDYKGQFLKQERYWQWWHKPDNCRSYQDTVEQFAEIFHQVMDDYTQQGRIAVPISGGLDSRSTIAAITRPQRQLPNNLHLWCYSYGYSDDSIETWIASQVASVRNLNFKAYTIQPYLFDKIGQILALTEGFQDITQCRQVFVCDEIASNADYIISALWGDVWLDDMGLVDKKNKVNFETTEDWLIDYTLRKMMKKGGEWLIKNLCQAKLSDLKAEELLKEIISKEMIPLQNIQDPDFRIKAFKTEQWSFRWSLPAIRVFQSAAFPCLVFYDTRLADFFCTVPSKYVSGRRLQIDYLKRFAPDLARITWQVYDANLYQYRYFNTWLLPKRALKKLWRILTRKRVIERNWEVQFLCPMGRAGLQRWLLCPGLRLHEFVPSSTICKLLDDFYKAPFENGRGYTVSMLLTFSAWLETYG